MLHRTQAAELDEVRGAIYFSPRTGSERLQAIRRFVRTHTSGRHRWGRLGEYPMIEFDTVADLTAVRTKFARLVEAYVDFTR